MKERALEMRKVLKACGSIYLHCDWHASHYLKAMMDEVFGQSNFQNEIIWYYKGAAVSPRRWARRHDTLLWYSKSKEWFFNPDPVRDEYAETTKERFSHYIGNVRGQADYGEQKLNPKGKHPDDVWQIKIVAPSARARLGYPTQKPEELLERVILASSRPGDIVLDPFAGCGTTLVVADRLERPWVGIDISPTACNLMGRRLLQLGKASAKLVGMPTTVAGLKQLKPFEFQNWIIDRIVGVQSHRKTGDMGIDGWTFLRHDPVQVKQSERVGRQRVDEFETAIKREGKTRGFFFAFSFTRGSVEEAARAKKDGLHIDLITIDDLVDDMDQVLTRMGYAPDLFGASAGLPKFDSKRRSATELIRSESGSGSPEQ